VGGEPFFHARKIEESRGIVKVFGGKRENVVEIPPSGQAFRKSTVSRGDREWEEKRGGFCL
jgi:hypothetical protein